MKVQKTFTSVGSPESCAKPILDVVYTAEDLVHHAKTAWYNMRGTLEDVFMRSQADAIEALCHAIVNDLQERMQQLGLPVRYTIADVFKGSKLDEFPADSDDVKIVVGVLGENLRVLSTVMGESSKALDAAGDCVSCQIVTNNNRSVEAVSFLLWNLVQSRWPEEVMEQSLDD